MWGREGVGRMNTFPGGKSTESRVVELEGKRLEQHRSWKCVLVSVLDEERRPLTILSPYRLKI